MDRGCVEPGGGRGEWIWSSGLVGKEKQTEGARLKAPGSVVQDWLTYLLLFALGERAGRSTRAWVGRRPLVGWEHTRRGRTALAAGAQRTASVAV